MKISYKVLQEYFATPLPSTEAVAEAFTFHCFEIDEATADMLDIKVLPNRAADCLVPEGIAAELAAILDLPLKNPSVPDYSHAPGVPISRARINATLGSDFSQEEIEDVLRRLRFAVEKDGEILHVKAPAPRTDIQIPEDVIEEVGRILGYDRIPSSELPSAQVPADQARFRGIERMRDQLVEQGFTEVSTQSFVKKGDIALLNPLDKEKPMLRTSLEENLIEARTKAALYAPLVLAPRGKPMLFEIGSVFPKASEYMELQMTERVPSWGEAAGTVDNLSIAKLEAYGEAYMPNRYHLSAYTPFSIYPFILRDIALWVPAETDVVDIEKTIRAAAGTLLVRLDQFDRFEKEGRVSYAFRMVFQSKERTLTDEEVNVRMAEVTEAVATRANWQVR